MQHAAKLGIAVALALAAPAMAHHGIASYDMNREFVIEGTITGVDWVNPHSWLYIDGTTTDGKVIKYRCELRAATVLRRSGWTPEMFPTGRRVQIEATAQRQASNSGDTAPVTFADGSQLDRYGQRVAAKPVEPPEAREPRLANGDPNITGDWAPEQFVMTDPRGQAGVLVPLSAAPLFEAGAVPAGREAMRGATNEGTVGAPAADPEVSQLARAPTWGADQVEVTALGAQAAEGFEIYTTANPRMRCETTSILFDWDFDGPVNRITQHDDRIVIEYGQYGFTRTIHMNMDAHPETITPSRAGHSIGRWEGNTLVVDTVGFVPGIIAPPVFHGEKLHVVERFTVDTDEWTLTRSYEATDPDYWVGTYAGTDDVFGIADAPFAADPCKELSFVDYGDPETADAASAAGSAAPATPAAAEEKEAPWWAFWEWF